MLERFTWYRQSAFRWRDDERTIYIDPWGTPVGAPLADVIFITHAHFDHFRPDEIERLSNAATTVVAPHDVAFELPGNVVAIAPGESLEVAGVPFTTVPAYNTRTEALDFHPKANGWVGYVLELDGQTYYHAGDTDHAPELSDVRADVAMLPVGGHFTMDVPAAAGLARAIGPSIAVPMHFGFAVGSSSDGDRFAREAAPVPVVVMTPEDPFERR
jgi:L-ascorbate metabolism protein UlaG (beta-lactamase superfamily)